MINSEVKDDGINLSLDGDFMTLMAEIFIVLTRLTYDHPEAIDFTVDFLKNGLKQDIKNGLELDTILDKITQAYFESRQ